MKTILNLILLVLFSVSQIDVSLAQGNSQKDKQIETIKFGFIAGRLDLNAKESQAFWPLYRAYQKDYNSLLQQKRQGRVHNHQTPEKAIDDDFYFETKLLELKKKYRLVFSKVLPADKLKKLYQAERDFREELIKQLKTRP